jgi:hypothetical protein
MKDDSWPGLQFPRWHDSTEQRVTLRGGDNPGPLEDLGVNYYMGNTKIATMFGSHGAQESADGLRWAIGRAGAMGCHLGANSENGQQRCGENRA